MPSVVICEKPSQARDIVTAVGNTYGQVLAAQGHLLRLQLPGEVNPAWEKWTDDLLYPQGGRYGYVPGEGGGKKEALDKIKRALSSADEVIIATDCDREGQGIGQSLLEFLKFKGRVRRAMFTAQDPTTLQTAFKSLKPNSEYQGMYDAFVARQQGDQIYNLSLTRVATNNLRPEGSKKPVGIGRVRSPTLGILCRRELEIRNFLPKEYFEVRLNVFGASGSADLFYRPSDENRIFIRGTADQIAGAAKAYSGPVHVKTERKERSPAKPMDLPTLQKRASQWGWTAKKTLDTAQDLYETFKIITYPRSESRYLNESLIPQAAPLLAMLKEVSDYASYSLKAPVIRKGKSGVFSDKQLEGISHHAIIPNINCPGGFAKTVGQLNPDQKRLFDLIARTFLAAIGEQHIYDQTKVWVDVQTPLVPPGKFTFSVTGSVPVFAGWKEIFEDKSDEDEEETKLPPLKNGEPVRARETEVQVKMTKPPPRYTEGSLIEAMQEAWKFVDDPAERERLKEAKGIGTPATRDTIIEGLKLQGQITVQKKNLVPTELGMQLYQILASAAPVIVDPGATARMEARLDDILSGKASADQVIKEISKVAYTLIPSIKQKKGSVTAAVATPPTKAMVQFAQTIAGRKNIPLPREVTKNFKACKAFIDQHNGTPQTGEGSGDWLLDKAQRLAQATNTPLRDSIKQDRAALKKFVDEADKKRGSEPASDSQMAWVKKLVDQGATPPDGYPDAVSKTTASKFLDAAFAKKAANGGPGASSSSNRPSSGKRPAGSPARRSTGAKA
ncbi:MULTISPECIES: type IA DNA topoisomerase [Microvirga]|uniref:type IA DNA topoisomerase n=1 Tax=Microvirga TaxID=186650 RepID=UPI0021C69680|nr:DNA topoisomerase [Microvirga sp. HBU65207]